MGGTGSAPSVRCQVPTAVEEAQIQLIESRMFTKTSRRAKNQEVSLR